MSSVTVFNFLYLAFFRELSVVRFLCSLVRNSDDGGVGVAHIGGVHGSAMGFGGRDILPRI